MQQILLLDNYDSFTYNLVHLLKEIGSCAVTVKRNDSIGVDEAEFYDKIILSPGPGIPEEAGILIPLIKAYLPRKPMLGVCLGHQAIAEASGARLVNLPRVFHGIASEMQLTETPGFLFEGIPNKFRAGRYHSWAVERGTLPESFQVSATDESGEIMAFQHKNFKVAGVQFHPESIMTEYGREMLANFLKI